jgi:hypothetical protein
MFFFEVLPSPQSTVTVVWTLSPEVAHSPNGSEKLIGSPPAYPYRLSPPASPIGSGCVK